MGKKDKKKNRRSVGGAEKTAARTEKKLSNKRKKELTAMGEKDVESILEEIEREEKARVQVKEVQVVPSRRINFSFLSHPDKDELILFGGEYFNGQKTFIFNDLFFYNIANDAWTCLQVPEGPPPRCGHQMVATSANKGQLWIFGGEFASVSQSQFHHYRDLWMFSLGEKKWYKLAAPNGPSGRSGHRMVYVKKQLIVFGGFHDNLRDYKYYNDVHIFDTETYRWVELNISGTAPSPRSGCCMIPLTDGRILIYGGYCKEKIKKDVDKGHILCDAFVLAPEKHDTTGTKWRWTQTKLGGHRFSPRCSMPVTVTPNNLAYIFGGVFDAEENEENISGLFYNDIFCLDLEKLNWRVVQVKKQEVDDDDEKKWRRKRVQADDDGDVEIDDNAETKREPIVVADDGVFTVTVGPACSSSTELLQMQKKKVENHHHHTRLDPSPRMNCGLAVKRGILYLYGGMIEDGDKQLVYNDFYALDLRKLQEWKIIVGDDKEQEWLDSDSETDSSETSDCSGSS